MLKVYKNCCKNCLLSKDRIVSPKRAKEIIQDCSQKQTYFICHKASMEEKDVVCANFYQTLGYRSQLVRIAQRLNAVQFIDQPDSEKLPTYEEISGKKTKKSNSKNIKEQ